MQTININSYLDRSSVKLYLPIFSLANSTLLPDYRYAVIDEAHNKLDSRGNADFKLLDFKVVERETFWEINVILYSKDGTPVLLDNIIIDEDFIKHS